MNNKEILSHCPNFYKICNFEYSQKDSITKRVIDIYKDYIFSVRLDDFDGIKKIEELDNVLSKYLDDYYFRKEMKVSLKELRVKKDDNILQVIVDYILHIFECYEDGYTRNIYISRWI